MDIHRNEAQPGYGITRRRILGGALAVAAGLATSTSGGAALASSRRDRVRLTMPAPTGPHDIGTVSLHLVDHTRQDPWLTTPQPRELMVSLWYPARGASSGHLAPWMTPGALAHYRSELTAFLNEPTGPDAPPPPPERSEAADGSDQVSLDGVDFPITHARHAAPVERFAHPRPVVLFSPGFAFDREHGTFVAEDLASHGYVVVTVSHTYDAKEVEFPGGRVELGKHDLDHLPHRAMQIRRADTRFVLDKLADLNTGAAADRQHHGLPVGLRGSLDLGRVGMFGHSLGGATTAQAMANDPRVRAGVNLDGSFFPDVDALEAGPEVVEKELTQLAHRIGNRPFMIMASGGFGPDYFGDLMSTVWYNLHGWRRFVSIVGSTHFTYTDLLPLLADLEANGILSEDPQIGVGLDPDRAVAIIRAYIRAFFDRWLRNRQTHLLDGPSDQYPEAKFYPPA
ncbi:MAG: hypothetical protein GEU96_11120 [Propionibacteriales bacterium]|nr:hypothetical protein [Propionibacteriales bacterium]